MEKRNESLCKISQLCINQNIVKLRTRGYAVGSKSRSKKKAFCRGTKCFFLTIKYIELCANKMKKKLSAKAEIYENKYYDPSISICEH